MGRESSDMDDLCAAAAPAYRCCRAAFGWPLGRGGGLLVAVLRESSAANLRGLAQRVGAPAVGGRAEQHGADEGRGPPAPQQPFRPGNGDRALPDGRAITGAAA